MTVELSHQPSRLGPSDISKSYIGFLSNSLSPLFLSPSQLKKLYHNGNLSSFCYKKVSTDALNITTENVQYQSKGGSIFTEIIVIIDITPLKIMEDTVDQEEQQEQGWQGVQNNVSPPEPPPPLPYLPSLGLLVLRPRGEHKWIQNTPTPQLRTLHLTPHHHLPRLGPQSPLNPAPPYQNPMTLMFYIIAMT